MKTPSKQQQKQQIEKIKADNSRIISRLSFKNVVASCSTLFKYNQK